MGDVCHVQLQPRQILPERVDVPKCIDHIAQKPKAILAKKVQTHLRTVLRVYLACIMICVLVYAPSHEIR